MEKLDLSTDIREITQEDLELIVGIIKKKCPKAYKEVDKENYQIIVDYLSRNVYNEIKK